MIRDCIISFRIHRQGGPVMKPLAAGDSSRVGKYALLGRLGSGGMGRVYLGQSPGGRLGRVLEVDPGVARH